jgi:hypothetical protein
MNNDTFQQEDGKHNMFNEEGRTFKSHVDESLRSVKNGQHLRFINPLYRTKEVCLVAVLYGCGISIGIRDLGSVPAGNLDYIYDQLKKEKGPYSLEEIENEVSERRKSIAEPGYFEDGKISCWQDLLKEYGAADYDDYLEKKFNQLTTEANSKLEPSKITHLHSVKVEVEMSPMFAKLYASDESFQSIIKEYARNYAQNEHDNIASDEKDIE